MTMVDGGVLYPEMLSKTNLLILDYNVLRYHSFDWIRYSLLKHENFKRLNPKYIELLNYSDDLTRSVAIAKREITEVNPLDVFSGYISECGKPFPASLSYELVQMFNSDAQHITMTDLSYRIGVIFGRNDIHGYLLKFRSDTKVEYNLPENVEVYESDHILNLSVLLKFIDEHNINAIMVDSVDLAASIAYKTKRQMTFMIANYRYNYDTLLDGSLMIKGVRNLNALEYIKKHEFGFFDPFCDLTEYMRRKIHDTNTINSYSGSVPEGDRQSDDQ